MAEVDTSSYPRPQPQANPLDTITKFGQAADAIGNLEAGKAVQGAIGPDGEIDRNALAQALKGTVAGSMKAIPTLQAHEQLRNAGFISDQSGLDTFRKRMELVNGVFASIAAKDNPTIQDVNNAAAHLLSPAINGPKYGLTFPVIMDALKKFRGPDGKPLGPAQIKQMAQDMLVMTQHSRDQLEAVVPQTGERDTGTDIRTIDKGSRVAPRYPVDVKRIPVGTPTIQPGSRAPVLTPPQVPAPTIYPGAGNALGGVVTPQERIAQGFNDAYGNRMDNAPRAALEPGVAAAATLTAENSAKLGNELVAAANQTPITEGILQNLDKTLGEFTSGPGADWKRVGKAFVNTVLPEGLKDKVGFDPKSIASQEEFNKQAYNLAQSQFQALGGTGTDAKLNSTMSTSPSELLSKEGNKGIIQILRGNNDALKAKAKAWNSWKTVHGEDSYGEFSEQFNDNFNPRVFQFKYIPKAQRNEWYQAMSPEDRRQFEKAAKYAKDQKWLRKEDLQ